jgi:hypothetical protein
MTGQSAIAPPGAKTGAPGNAGVVERGDFRFAYDDRGISLVANPHDPFGATLTTAAAARAGGRGATPGAGGAVPAPAAVLGLTLAYRASAAGDWTSVSHRDTMTASPDAGTVAYTSGAKESPLAVTETFRTDGRALDWLIDLQATGKTPVTVGDLGISIPVAGPAGATPTQIFERGFLKHQFVSGAGSFSS